MRLLSRSELALHIGNYRLLENVKRRGASSSCRHATAAVAVFTVGVHEVCREAEAFAVGDKRREGDRGSAKKQPSGDCVNEAVWAGLTGK